MYLLKELDWKVIAAVLGAGVLCSSLVYLMFAYSPELSPSPFTPNATETPTLAWSPTPTPTETPAIFETNNTTKTKTMSAAEMCAAGMYGRGGGGSSGSSGDCPPCDSCCPPCPPIPELPTGVYMGLGLIFGVFCGRMQRRYVDQD